MAWPVQVGFGRDPAAFTLAVYMLMWVWLSGKCEASSMQHHHSKLNQPKFWAIVG